MVTINKAIDMLSRLRDPEPWDPKLTSDCYESLDLAISVLKNTSNVVEKHGKWSLNVDLLTGYTEARCSNCGSEFIEGSTWLDSKDYWNYCPNCGIRMDE